MKLQYLTREHGQGPFYLASGFRPSGIAALCNVQCQGQVMPATYYSTSDTFRDVTGCRIDPECWSFLPPAYPNTEREWWMQQEWRYDGDDDSFHYKGYACFSKYGPAGLWLEGKRIANSSSVEDAREDSYNHWVAAGRPLIQSS